MKTKFRFKPLPSSMSSQNKSRGCGTMVSAARTAMCRGDQQPRHARPLVADIDARRPGTRHLRECLGDACLRMDHLFRIRFADHPRIALEISEQLCRKVLWRRQQNAIGIASGPHDGVTQGCGRAVDDFHRSHGGFRGSFKLLDCGLRHGLLHRFFLVDDGENVSTQLQRNFVIFDTVCGKNRLCRPRCTLDSL